MYTHTHTQDHIEEKAEHSHCYSRVKHECAKPGIFPLIHSRFYLGPGIRSDHYLVKAVMRNKHLFSTAVGKLLSLAPGDLEVTAMRQSKSWAKNLITRETGLFGTELQLAAVVARLCIHGAGAEWPLVTQCTSQKCGMSSSCVHLITLCFWSCVHSWLVTRSFLTSHSGTRRAQEMNKHLSRDAESVHAELRVLVSSFHFVLGFQIGCMPVLAHKVNLSACILNALNVSSVLLILLPL